MDVVILHRRACAEFGSRVPAIGSGQWQDPTPCEGWSVRDLVAHIVDECRWTPPLLAGLTIDEVGDRLAGDPLGDDPVGAWEAAAAAATQAAADVDRDRTVHLSFGNFPARFYLRQLAADHVVHAWDLARAVGADERLDPELVDVLAAWFARQEEAYRAAGAIGERQPLPDDADAQARLLAAFGRSV
ncbi:MAG TPA: TIGR03086 family metal-binding protein [Egibacteraceae bacterium]|nr:TIGR03086 family metal-binding protein [Egibacteraceae bacterium]